VILHMNRYETVARGLSSSPSFRCRFEGGLSVAYLVEKERQIDPLRPETDNRIDQRAEVPHHQFEQFLSSNCSASTVLFDSQHIEPKFAALTLGLKKQLRIRCVFDPYKFRTSHNQPVPLGHVGLRDHFNASLPAISSLISFVMFAWRVRL